MKPNWERLESEVRYENLWIRVYHEAVIAPTGRRGQYGRVHYKHYALGIIPLDTDGSIWLIGQQRYPIDRYTWEIPEGGGRVGDDPLTAAVRELQEEAGLAADEWTEIQRMHLSNSVSDELAIIYLARGIREAGASPDPTESLTIRKIPFDEAFSMVWKGEITDAMTVAGLFRLRYMFDQKIIAL